MELLEFWIILIICDNKDHVTTAYSCLQDFHRTMWTLSTRLWAEQSVVG